MHYSYDQLHELDLLIQFKLDSMQQGIKVHSNAKQETIDAVERLFDKGLVTQIDGGYLTEMGRTAAEHAQALYLLLSPHIETVSN